MKLSSVAFNRHLAHMGQSVQWRRSFACPCTNPHSGAAKPGCPVCGGKGRAWHAAVNCTAAVCSQKAQLEWAKFGQYESGDTVLSLASDSVIYDMSQFDRVVLLNSTDRFSMPLVRGNTDKLRFSAQSISRVFWLDANNAIVDGGIPEVGADGALTWLAGEPAIGTTYTIEGQRMPEYFCWGQIPSDRGIHQGAQLPRKAILRKFDLFGK